jgi:CheY-like chemotaxis protein
MARILLIDRDVESLDVLTGLLRAAGHEVVTARTAETGLRSAQEHSCDLILAELPRPEPRGRDLLRELRKRKSEQPGQGEQAFQSHAAVRWARAVVGVLGTRTDPRTLREWGRVVGAAAGTLRGWCRTAGTPAKQSLDFARLLRAVSQAESRGWQPEQLLNVVDGRTLTRLLRLGGLDRAPQPVSIRQFLARQSLVSERSALDALEQLLFEDDGRAPVSEA